MVERIDREVYAKYDKNPSINGRVIGLWKLCLVAFPTFLMNLSFFNDHKCGIDALKCYDTNHECYDYDMKLIWIIFFWIYYSKGIHEITLYFSKIRLLPFKIGFNGKKRVEIKWKWCKILAMIFGKLFYYISNELLRIIPGKGYYKGK